MKARRFGIIAVFLVLAVLVGACAPATPVPTPTPSAKETLATGVKAPPTSPVAQLIKLKVGEPVPKAALLGLPFRVAQDKGFFQKRGLEVEIVSFQGDAPLTAAMASGSLDIASASASGAIPAIVKGVPWKIIAVNTKTITTFGILVPMNSPIKSAKDLKGKKLAITSFGAMTDWLVKRTATVQGWDPEKGIERVAMGGAYMPMATAMNSGQVDAMVWTFYTGYELEEKGLGKLAFRFDESVTLGVEHSDIAASDKLLRENPAVVKRFLESLFEAIKYMKANKAYAIDMMANPDVVGISRGVAEKSYEGIMDAYSDDGTLSEAAAKDTIQSLLDLGTLKELPSPGAIYDKQFVPVKVQ